MTGAHRERLFAGFVAACRGRAAGGARAGAE
jgi:hypothetical protein